MYLDAVIVVALIIFAICWFRRFSKLVYAFGIIDIFLRLLHFISSIIGIKGFYKWVKNIFPMSIPDIMDKYTSGIVYDILIWIYAGLMVFFLFYSIRSFIRKKG